MINLIKKNKKGESMLVDFWAILIFAIIALAIFLLIMFIRSDNTQTIQDEFSNKDVNLMLNSFLRAPYGAWGGQSMAEVIGEENVKNDYSKTIAVFRKYFRGVDVYSDNPVGGYILIIDGQYVVGLDLDNDKFKEQLGKSKLISKTWTSTFIPMPIGEISKVLGGLKINSLQHKEARTIIPRSDGKDIEVKIIIIYDQKYAKKFS